MNKHLRQLILLIISSLGLIFFVYLDWPDENVHIIFCDVGQGDAILIYDGFKQILIDSGANYAVMSCLDRHMPFWDREIELAVATHADTDHIGGFEGVLGDYLVHKMILTEFGRKTDVFSGFRQAVLREEKMGMELIFSNLTKNFFLTDRLMVKNLSTRGEGIDFTIFDELETEGQLWDKIDAQAIEIGNDELDLNALSVVNLVVVGQFKLLLTGDLNIAGEQALVEAGLITDVDVLKIGHHGSKSSTGETFLAISRPEIAVISVGDSNSYGHPNYEILTKLGAHNLSILRTDELGDVEIVTNGESYWIEK